MEGNWIGLLVVAIISIAVVACKSHRSQETENASEAPCMVPVAGLNKANSEDNCALIIDAVRAARGVAV